MASILISKVVRALLFVGSGCFLFSQFNLSAQVVTATLTGTVIDSSGSSVPNAIVTVTEKSTSIARTAKTSADGVYSLPFLNPGVYEVDVEASGFKRYTQETIQLDVSTTARLDVKLTLGNASETVT
ncbi:MAG: carboxypeptidase-like regulatory domain-containing protein, partial [Acidobacteriota bacterium]|nr:carboxypeptidase-like regulatory domain-containing protein [Acidobacteriota bacterium]